MTEHNYTLDTTVTFHVVIPSCGASIMHTVTIRDLFSAPDGELLISERELGQLTGPGVESWIEVMGDTCLDYLVRVQWDRGLTGRMPVSSVSSEVAP